MDAAAKRERLGHPKGEGPHVQWDEEIIAEHDKLRGTRQKIEEPPTPYRYDDGDDDGDEEKLMSNGSGSGSDSGSGSGSGSGLAIPIPSGNELVGSSLSSRNTSAMGGGGIVGSPTLSNSSGSPQTYASSPSTTRVGDNVMDVWESLKAKLHYEQQKQRSGTDLRAHDSASGYGSAVNGNKGVIPSHINKSVGLAAAAGGAGHASRDSSRGGCRTSTLSSSIAAAAQSAVDNNNDNSSGNDSTGAGIDVEAGSTPSVETVGFDRVPKAPTASFKAARSAHYNEFQLMQAMRKKRMEESDEDEDED